MATKANKAPGGTSIRLGDVILEITDPHNIQPVSADLYTENRAYNGIVCLSFACVIADGDAKPRAEITSRIRLTLAGAIDLQNALAIIVKGAMGQSGKAN